MATVGMMEIALNNGIITADAKKGMIDLRSIEKMGMAMANIEKMENYSKRVSLWLELDDTKEFLQELNKKYTTEDKFSKDLLVKEGKRNFKLWADVLVGLKYAMYVNKELEVEVLDTFVNKRILDFRIMGMDKFGDMNKAIDRVIGMQERDDYRNIAIAINTRVNKEFKKGWDDKGADEQSLRMEIMTITKKLVDRNRLLSIDDVIDFIANY
ncbi:MAG: KilA-N domain-containing protein [Cetobacterium sp.]